MISQTDLEDYLGIGAGTDTDIITALELAAVRWIEQATRRYFRGSGNVTEYLRGDNTPTLWLAEVPAQIPTTVTYRYTIGSDQTITATDSDGYVLRTYPEDPRNPAALIRKGGNIWWRSAEFEVTYSRGYAADGEPADIREAVKRLVKIGYERVKAGSSSADVISEKLGDYSYTLGEIAGADGGMTVISVVNQWKRMLP